MRGECVDQIYSLARGNPLFIRELVEDMRWQPRVDGAEANGVMGAMKGSAVPGRVRVLTEARLAALDTPVQRVLFLAAVAGGAEIPLTELRAGAAALEPPVSGEALFDALDRALELRLLEERISGYAFRHPLMRRAIYERLSRHRRAQFGNALHQSRHALHQSRPARDPSPRRWKHDRNGAGTPRQNES